MEKPTVIDLFCGIGGFSKGFEMAGFDVLFGIDIWDIAIETFQHNHKNTEGILADLTELDDDFFKQYTNKVDVIIAGPPCQGFSMCGKREVGDKRNELFQEVVRAVKIINPKIVIIENVVGLLSMENVDGEDVKGLIVSEFEKLGYETNYKILDASEHGVPQKRKRVIFIGSRIGDVEFPKPKDKKVSVMEALGNIPDTNFEYYDEPTNSFQELMADGEKKIYNHDAMKHNEKVLKRIENVPQGGNWQDIPPEIYDVGGTHSNNYRRLDPNKPSITIKHAIKSMIIHPTFNRVITAREAARLQSIPDSFIIKGNKTAQHQQLANAVPPLLGYEIGKQIIKKLN
ncbi:DNA-cytosine methyltransferase [Methanobrevibacter ruminantium M1]|uniref:DNA (cytosine-5-)-methyltransferase n=1 Tax=Methanobrevibacter ruminantium (strain ATCC 35063 / DSM 1093 / JCM 13430 / OCM 146 / M1) TaxID=634498 RepID=D3E4I3_METRM|nr:DNA cytosine methyltransferase [Methanobrevibacter ruminantium]ADC45879.1 DNA-cytosine methyltransferase [Methanobrevibacter ruminantium M1]